MARRRFGQHFLIDRRACGRIVRALRIEHGDPVLEIGPGRGALTAELLQRAGRMIAVEVDRDLADALGRRFDESRLSLVVGDLLRLDLGELLTSTGFASGGLLVAGNLPYNISKPIVQKLIRERGRIERAVLMFQREVAERLTARPGTKRYGPLSVLSRLCFEIEPLFDLSPRAFVPPPKVDSTVTRWNRLTDSALDADLERRLRSVLATCFSRRRRTLRNNLRGGLGDEVEADALLGRADLDGARRPETLSPEEFVRMARAYRPPLV